MITRKSVFQLFMAFSLACGGLGAVSVLNAPEAAAHRSLLISKPENEVFSSLGVSRFYSWVIIALLHRNQVKLTS